MEGEVRLKDLIRRANEALEIIPPERAKEVYTRMGVPEPEGGYPHKWSVKNAYIFGEKLPRLRRVVIALEEAARQSQGPQSPKAQEPAETVRKLGEQAVELVALAAKHGERLAGQGFQVAREVAQAASQAAQQTLGELGKRLRPTPGPTPGGRRPSIPIVLGPELEKIITYAEREGTVFVEDLIDRGIVQTTDPNRVKGMLEKLVQMGVLKPPDQDGFWDFVGRPSAQQLAAPAAGSVGGLDWGNLPREKLAIAALWAIAIILVVVVVLSKIL